MRELLPLLDTLNAITTIMGIPRDPTTTISSVWEDNEAALTIMNNHVNGLPKLTPRTRHIACKYHWFLGKLGTNIIAKKCTRRSRRLISSLRACAQKISSIFVSCYLVGNRFVSNCGRVREFTIITKKGTLSGETSWRSVEKLSNGTRTNERNDKWTVAKA
jgi:hypothetical protein